MPAGTRGNQNETVHAGFERFARVPHVDHVVQHDAAVAVHGVHDFLGRRPQARNEDGHLVLHAHANVLLEPHIRLMHDLVHGNGTDHGVGVRGLVRCELLLDLREPFVEQFRGPRIERGKRTDDASLALREHEFGIADDEHRRSDDRQRKVLQDGGQGHGESLLSDGRVRVASGSAI